MTHRSLALYVPPAHVLVPGQVYQSCAARGDTRPARIQVVAAPAEDGRVPVVDARTGRPRRPVAATSFFASPSTRAGSERRSGWALLEATEYIGDYLDGALRTGTAGPDYFVRGCSINDDPRAGGYVTLWTREAMAPAVHALAAVGWFAEDAHDPQGWAELRVRYAGAALCPATERFGGGRLVRTGDRGHGDDVDHWDPIAEQQWSV